MLGGLAASGWHTCALLMRMIADGFVLASNSMGSPGVEEVRWLKPVRPGDRLTARATVLETRPSNSRPGMGFVKFRYEMLDQSDGCVMTLVSTMMIARRGFTPASAMASARAR
jgi:acyl dehydratase